MTNRAQRIDTVMRKLAVLQSQANRQFPAVENDDNRIEYCPSCEDYVMTVPAEGVPNQALRACCACGVPTESLEN